MEKKSEQIEKSWVAEVPFWFLYFVWKGFLPVCRLSLALPGGVYEAQHQGPKDLPLLEVQVTAWR